MNQTYQYGYVPTLEQVASIVDSHYKQGAEDGSSLIGFNLGHLFSSGEPPLYMINITTAFNERSQMATLQSRILYIEDHEDTRDLVSLVLTGSNYQVTRRAALRGWN